MMASKVGGKIDYSKTSVWDPGKNYNTGDIVKHNSLIFEAKDDSFDFEPMWPRMDNNPWTLKVLI